MTFEQVGIMVLAKMVREAGGVVEVPAAELSPEFTVYVMYDEVREVYTLHYAPPQLNG